MKIYGPVELSKSLYDLMIKAIEHHTLQEIYDRAKNLKSTDPSVLDELKCLIEDWSGDYPANILIAISGTGLKTHMRADGIALSHGFELDGPEGDGGNGIRKQWKRLENPIDDRVLAIVTYAYDGTEGKTVIFEKDKIVRPHLGGECRDRLVRSELYTPEKLKELNDHNLRYNAVLDEMQDEVDKFDFNYVTYSACKRNADGIPVNNLHDVAIEGKAILFCATDYKGQHFDENRQFEDYKSDVVENPTWLDICGLANKMIPCVGDYHHTFLEAIVKTDRAENGIPIYEFSMGS